MQTSQATALDLLPAALYTRQSLDANGDGMAVGRQDELGRKLADVRELKITHTFCDNDISAAGKVERPDFERLLKVIEAGLVRAVIAQAMDRLARNQSDGVRLLKACARHRVKLIFISGGDIELDTPMGQFVASMMILIAELEVGIKGQRQKIANRQRASLGVLRRSSRRPFGWLDDRRTPHPVEGAAVEAAYATILGGGSVRSIVAKWNADGLACTQGAKRWTIWSVRGVLLNPHHAGLTSIDGEILGKGDWAPLIDEDTFAGVKAKLEAKKGNGQRGVRSLLGGVALCPCGAKVTAAKNVRGQPTYRHQRPAGLDDGGAYHVARMSEPVNDWVISLVIERLSRNDAADLLVNRDRPDLSSLRLRQQALLTRADEQAALFAEGALTARQVAVSSAKLAEQLAEVEAALTDAGKVNVLGPIIDADDPRAAWFSLHLDQKRAVIDQLFSSITLRKPGMGRQDRHDPSETVDIEWRTA